MPRPRSLKKWVCAVKVNLQAMNIEVGVVLPMEKAAAASLLLCNDGRDVTLKKRRNRVSGNYKS